MSELKAAKALYKEQQKKLEDDGQCIFKDNKSKANASVMSDIPGSPKSQKSILEKSASVKKERVLSPKQRYVLDQQGFVQFPDGSKYKGPMSFGNPHGVGCIIYGDGSKYEGNW